MQHRSEVLKENPWGDPFERALSVYLPAGYATSEKRYPVVFALPGYGQRPFSIAADMSDELDTMIESGEVEEMIIVFVDGTNRFVHSWYLSSDV